MLLHPREANPGHYDAVLRCSRAGIVPRVALRDVSVDLQHTPVLRAARWRSSASRRASASPPADLGPLVAPATLEVQLLARALGRTPAVTRLVASAQEVADELAGASRGG